MSAFPRLRGDGVQVHAGLCAGGKENNTNQIPASDILETRDAAYRGEEGNCHMGVLWGDVLRTSAYLEKCKRATRHWRG